MKHKIFIIFLSMIILSVFSINMVVLAQEEPVHLRFGSHILGSSWYIYAATIAEVIRPELPEGSTIDVLPYGGGNAFAYLLHEGKADISLASTPAQKWAYYGETDDFDEEMTDLRALVGGMDAYYYAFIVPEDSEFNSVEEVLSEPRPIKWMTLPGASMGKQQAEWILDYYNMTWDDIVNAGGKVEHTGFGAITSAFRDYRIDVFSHTINIGHPAVTEIATARKVKFLPYSPDMIEEFVQKYDQRKATLPAGTFPGQDSDVLSWGNTTGITATTRLPDDIAYLITKAICENAETLKERVVAFTPFDPGKAADFDVNRIPLHPGAIKYYRERGWIK